MNLFPWNVFLPEGFENGIIPGFVTGDYMEWDSISLFAGFLEKEILWKLWLWFSKKFYQRVFCDWIWRILKFRFWRQILDIYRRPLLKRWSWKSWNLTKVVVCFSQSVEWTGECTLWSLKNLQVLIYSKLHEKNHVITYTKVIVLYCILLVLVNNKKGVALRTCP